MTDAAFAELCADNPDVFFEMTAEGELIAMPPNYTLDGIRNVSIGCQLYGWNREHRRGFVSGSSGGFVLPNGARRSPDASWTGVEQVNALTAESLATYWRLCPAFVIEFCTSFDHLPVLHEKMREYIANGAQLGWMIDPKTHTVEIYRPDREPESRTDIDSIAGEGPVEGLVCNLKKVWDPLA